MLLVGVAGADVGLDVAAAVVRFLQRDGVQMAACIWRAARALGRRGGGGRAGGRGVGGGAACVADVLQEAACVTLGMQLLA